MARILLLGAGGQLGMQLKQVLAGTRPTGTNLTALTRTEVDLADPEAIRAAIRQACPQILINAAAYTAVDKAESDQEAARLVNAVAPGVMAEEMAKSNGWLIHYSTDYVFDGSGTRAWVETDTTGPLGVYGQTKLDGEIAVAASGCRHVILRTSWVYAAVGKNFLHTMLRLGRERERLTVVDDQIGAPTTAEAITEATLVVLRSLDQLQKPNAEPSGVYHLACGGETSWCGFAREIFAEFASRQKAPEVAPIPTEAYPTPARRPKNSRLNCDKFEAQFGFRMPQWGDALHAVAQTMLAET
jgi:dTDP-4-dehydrorhamnose reductase